MAKVLKKTINIPVSDKLKKQVAALAEKFPGSPKPTVFARLLLEDGVKRAENGNQPGEVELQEATK